MEKLTGTFNPVHCDQMGRFVIGDVIDKSEENLVDAFAVMFKRGYK